MEARQPPLARRGALPAHRRPPLPRRPVPATRSRGMDDNRERRVRPRRSRPRSGPARSTRWWRGRAGDRRRARAAGRRAAGADRAGRRRAGAAGVRAMAAEDMGFTCRRPPVATAVGLPGGRHRRGRSGMLAAIRLAEAGIDHVVLEKNADVGGTWWRTPTRRGRRHPEPPLLVLVRAARAGPPTSASATRCQAYLRDVADAHDLRRVIRFGTEVASAVDATSAGSVDHRRRRDAHRGRRDHRRRTAQPAEDPTAAGPGRVPGPAVPLGALARRTST